MTNKPARPQYHHLDFPLLFRAGSASSMKHLPNLFNPSREQHATQQGK